VHNRENLTRFHAESWKKGEGDGEKRRSQKLEIRELEIG
jgi:hypothetical protein